MRPGVDGHWRDDFDGPAGSAPDPRCWTSATGGGGWGNHELQEYTGRPQNVALDGAGCLAMTARRDPETGAITSSRVTSEGLVTFTHGVVSARILVPRGDGLLPAFWLLGDDLRAVGYPASGELDVMESPDARDVVHQTVHGPRVAAGSGSGAQAAGTERGWQRGTSVEVGLDGWHVYAVRRAPGEVRMTIDGEPTYLVRRTDCAAGEEWVFDKPFHILFSLAVGGVWPAPLDVRCLPARMLIDWVEISGL
jgi:beta-glucanase (GH16 family)